jgi:hypothetical protein
MPTPVEISLARRSALHHERVERLGGFFRGRPWSMSERNVIVEIEQPDSVRQWDFFILIAGLSVPVTIMSANGRKWLAVRGMPCASLGLPELPP